MIIKKIPIIKRKDVTAIANGLLLPINFGTKIPAIIRINPTKLIGLNSYHFFSNIWAFPNV